MQYISLVLFAISGSLDSFIITFSYSLNNKRISLPKNLFISAITLFGTVLSICFAELSTHIIPIYICELIGKMILCIYGIYYVTKAAISFCRNENGIYQRKEKKEKPLTIPWSKALFLGITLSLNNVGIGICAGAIGLKLIPAALSTFISSVLLIICGGFLGKIGKSAVPGYICDFLSGALLICLTFIC